MIWILILLLLLIVGYTLDREVYFYEGVHLGPRIQAWLYDQWAKKYDEGKHASQLRDDEMLAKPLIEACKAQALADPFILDFAAGTGRLSYALLKQPDFRGRLVAVDLSQGMLERAASKLSRDRERVELLRHPALPLPFPDETFDVVCAVEVLELFPGMDAPLAELTRVLRPGGILFASRGTEESGRKAKVKSIAEFKVLLERHGLGQVRITKWWKFFDRVLAVKQGSAAAGSKHELSQVLYCRKCGKAQWQRTTEAWECLNCGKELPVTKEGIVLN